MVFIILTLSQSIQFAQFCFTWFFKSYRNGEFSHRGNNFKYRVLHKTLRWSGS